MKLKGKSAPLNRQGGQTLIETITAIFILTTGLCAGLALAIYSFGASSNIGNRIAAAGLAREGVEIVRRIRDSNWLSGTLTTCSDIGSFQTCYPNWLTNITGSVSGTAYRAIFAPGLSGEARWYIDTGTNYRLYLEPQGVYTIQGPGAKATNLFRKVTITYVSTSGDYSPISPLVSVRSVVWWWGKNCPNITDYNSPSDTTCKVISEEFLTNWKNY